ncbi:hypothetical protein [Methylobacterium pseudosasicola]|uniref:XRE family transcriptional regulator n=1 Tax=Methylobacterium pseudosasicola TaxID=582667 RepID=A0A1I4NKG1_9HYPH|nr:hypothetical protein [Methylobacterium pseudosasicola]SFM15959.1 hypothetical protein SAMN05192568_102134 [Methylobacterium pseudosasicola]
MDYSAVHAIFLRHVAAAGSHRAFARMAGVSAIHVGDVVHGRRKAGPAILAAIGIERRVEFVQVRRA